MSFKQKFNCLGKRYIKRILSIFFLSLGKSIWNIAPDKYNGCFFFYGFLSELRKKLSHCLVLFALICWDSSIIFKIHFSVFLLDLLLRKKSFTQLLNSKCYSKKEKIYFPKIQTLNSGRKNYFNLIANYNPSYFMENVIYYNYNYLFKKSSDYNILLKSSH